MRKSGLNLEEINLLFAIDSSFLRPLETTLLSIKMNTSRQASLHIYVIHGGSLGLDSVDGRSLSRYCEALDIIYTPILANSDEFSDAPVSERYPETIYYRLLAHRYLPNDLDRVLYLDADILCINDLSKLYNMVIDGDYYAAASHSRLTELTTVVNKVRLRSYESEGYFNSGVLLINLNLVRQRVHANVIYNYITTNKYNLLLPDQDVLNGLYGDKIKDIPDEIYNFDVRKIMTYQLISNGEWDLDWTIDHTVFLHFCGKEKPWFKKYRGRFDSLYKHYEHQSYRLNEKLNLEL